LVTREPGKEKTRTIVEKEDVGVENASLVCAYRHDGPSFFVRG
jgi:hypothetical protein